MTYSIRAETTIARLVTPFAARVLFNSSEFFAFIPHRRRSRSIPEFLRSSISFSRFLFFFRPLERKRPERRTNRSRESDEERERETMIFKGRRMERESAHGERRKRTMNEREREREARQEAERRIERSYENKAKPEGGV